MRCHCGFPGVSCLQSYSFYKREESMPENVPRGWGITLKDESISWAEPWGALPCTPPQQRGSGNRNTYNHRANFKIPSRGDLLCALDPKFVSTYIYELETNCDPSGNVQELIALRENVGALQRIVVDLKSQLMTLNKRVEESQKTLQSVLDILSDSHPKSS